MQRPEYSLSHWTVEHGLPQNNVQALLQTSDGYIWIGTWFGLARYDGVRFTLFTEDNTPEMRATSANAICLAEDADGDLWVGTANGLLRRRDHRFEIFTTTNGLPHNRIWSLVPRRSGGVWIGTAEGLAWLNGEQVVSIPVADGIGWRGLAGDREGRVYFTARGRLQRLDPTTEVLEELFDRGALSLGRDAVWVDKAGSVWIGTRHGLVRWSDGEAEEFHYSDEPAADSVFPNGFHCHFEDQTGALWFGIGKESLLARFDGRHLSLFTGHPAVTNRTVTSFLADREGNLWLGTHGDGLFCLRPKRVKMLQTGDPRADELRSVSEGAGGVVWTASNKGVVRWDGDEFTILSEWIYRGKEPWVRLTNPGADSVLVIDDHLLAGQGTHGLWLWDGKNWEQDPVRLSIGGYHGAGVFARDSSERIWFGCDGKLYWWRGSIVQEVELPKAFHARGVRAVCESADGSIWIGTNGGGIGHWTDEGLGEVFTVADGLSDQRLCVLYEDDDGILWAGTEHGLNRLKDGRLFAFYTSHGLFDNMVNHLVEDDFGSFWISCNRGIYRVKRSDLNAVADGQAERVEYVAYGEADGMATAETNGEHQTAGCKTHDGKICFPTGKGLAVIDPGSIQDNELPPPVVIEQVAANGEVVFGDGTASEAGSRRTRQGGIVIEPGSSDVIRIAYTANSFVDPGKVRFRYRLDGYERQWRDAGEAADERVVYYTNLKPGLYRFHVVACNNHGFWNEDGARFAFYVAPHFYQTWAFYGLCAAVALGAGFVLHRQRVTHLRRLQQVEHQLAIERERRRIAEDMHDDVGSRLSEIALLGELVQRGSELDQESDRRVARIAQTARHTSEALQEIVWAVNPRNDLAEKLVEYLCQHIEETLHNAGLRCRIETGSNWPDTVVESEVRHSVFLAVKEAISNIIRHAEASEVRGKLACRDGKLEVIIEDDGRGFAPDAPRLLSGQGDGIRNMRRRMERLGGSFAIEGKPGGGTRVELRVPLS